MDFWKARNLPFHIFLFITNEKSHSCRFNRRNTFEKISRFRSTNSIQFTKICLNIADYDYTSSILSSFSSTFRCIKRYPSRIEKQINREKKGRAFRLESLCTMKRRWRRASTGIFFNGPWPRYSRSGDTCQIIIERFPRYYRKRSDVLLYIATRVARDPMIDRYGGATSISPCY